MWENTHDGMQNRENRQSFAVYGMYLANRSDISIVNSGVCEAYAHVYHLAIVNNNILHIFCQ